MTLDDLIVAAGMVLAIIVFTIGSVVRSLRRLRRMRPDLAPGPAPPRRVVMPRPPARVPKPVSPKRAAVPKRRPAPALEARLFGNRRLSAGARLVVASEILSRPKALRPRRPL